MRRLLACFVTVLGAIAALVVTALPAAAIVAPTVRVTPGTSTVVVGGTRQLTATVANLADTSVVWSMESGPGSGSVSASGLYTPPASPPPDGPAIIRATSVEDGTVHGDATVTVTSGVAGGGFGAGSTIRGGSTEIATGDVNGDGIADIVRLQGLANSVHVWDLVTMVSDGAGGFTTTTSPVGSDSNATWINLSLGDVDGDGDLDAVVSVEDSTVTPQTDPVQIYRNDGTGTLTAEPIGQGSNARVGATAVALVDWDGDGHLDLVRLHHFGTVSWQRGDGTGVFGAPVVLFSVSDGRYLAVGDLTGDGRPDVVVGGQTSQFVVEHSFTVAANDGFGGVAGTTAYDTGTDPRPVVTDIDGDGWNDVVVAAGRTSSASPPNLLAFRNLATGNGGLDTTPVTLLAGVDAQQLTAVDANGDGMLDIAGVTATGPFLAQRTGPSTFTALHASGPFFAAGFADVDGDGRLDVFTSNDTTSSFWPGSSDTSLHFSVDPTVTRVDATLSTDFSTTVRNDPVPPSTSWSASRGSFSGASYTAPASASPSGSPVTVTASLAGTSATATRDITVVNDQFEFTALGSRQVRAVVTDPTDADTVYAATDAGVFRSTNGGATFGQVGTTATTGTDAQALTLVRDDGAGVAALVALFGTAPYRYDLTGSGDWVTGGGGSFTTATSVASVPGSQVLYATSGGVVWRSIDAATTWTSVGGTNVTSVAPIDASTFWAVRSNAPRVETGAVSGGSATFTDRSTPYPSASVTALTADPAAPGTAYVAISQPGWVQMLRGDADTGVWTDLPTPVATTRIAVSPAGDLLAAVSGSTTLLKSVDDGASWYSVARGFAGAVTTSALAFRADGLALVGTSSGLYTPVETVAPDAPSITDGPTGTTGPGGANSFSFSFTTTGSSALCELDGGSWASCSGGTATYSGPLTEGSHTFRVVAVDDVGNESAPATRTWSVDATPPAAPSNVDGPSGLVASTQAQFSWDLPGDAAGSTCSLDDATPTPCTTGQSYSSLGQGAHSFAVRAVDAYGNASPAVTQTWQVDTIPPQFPWFGATPQQQTSSTSAFFTWATDSGATYSCTLDTEAVACGAEGSYSVSGLAPGQHTFAVTASDLAGNTSGPDSYTWTIDTTAPAAPTITAHPATLTNATTADFSFASDSPDVQRYICTLDTATQVCSGMASYTGLDDGEHTFEVTTQDLANNTSEPTSFTWTIDTAVPNAPTITAHPAALTKATSADFSFASDSSDVASYTCTLDGNSQPCSSPVSYAGPLSETVHTFEVTATDGAGNRSSSVPFTWTIDTTAPGVSLATPSASLQPVLRASFTEPVTGADKTTVRVHVAGGSRTLAASLICRNASGVTTSCTGASVRQAVLTPTAALVPGQHYVFVVSALRDPAGNVAASRSVSFTAPTKLQETSVAARPAWRRVARSSARGGSYTAAHMKGASATYTFSGSSVTWYAVTGRSFGTANVFLDGTAKGKVNLYAASAGTTSHFFAASRSGRHTLRIVVRGEKGSRHGTGTMVSVDAFKVGGTVAKTPPLTYTWRRVAAAKARGGGYAVADLAGATFKVTFRGTGIIWTTVTGRGMGKASVRIDGHAARTFDQWSSSLHYGVTRSFTGLADGLHTLTITVQGRHRSGATGYAVAVDQLLVRS